MSDRHAECTEKAEKKRLHRNEMARVRYAFKKQRMAMAVLATEALIKELCIHCYDYHYPSRLRAPGLCFECVIKGVIPKVGQLRMVESRREFCWEQDGLLYVYDMQTELPGALIGPWDGT
jgi:hypothetical protein